MARLPMQDVTNFENQTPKTYMGGSELKENCLIRTVYYNYKFRNRTAHFRGELILDVDSLMLSTKYETWGDDSRYPSPYAYKEAAIKTLPYLVADFKKHFPEKWENMKNYVFKTKFPFWEGHGMSHGVYCNSRSGEFTSYPLDGWLGDVLFYYKVWNFYSLASILEALGVSNFKGIKVGDLLSLKIETQCWLDK